VSTVEKVCLSVEGYGIVENTGGRLLETVPMSTGTEENRIEEWNAKRANGFLGNVREFECFGTTVINRTFFYQEIKSLIHSSFWLGVVFDP
jgi:hypothetical protein